MKKLFFLLIFWFLSQSVHAQSDIYGFSLDSANGGPTINFSQFSGKRILVVETASGDTSTFFQYNDLMILGQVYKDSLVVIVVPTNSFGNEPLDSLHLDSLYKTPDGSHQFYVAKKADVSGSSSHPLFQWLSSATSNGVMDVTVNKPFVKFLIGRDGKLAGVIGSRTRPMETVFFEAIKTLR